MAVLEPSRLNLKVQELCTQLKMLALQQGPGTKLPTTRQLCHMLDTNPTTLNDALRQLEIQNVISRRQGSGIFVSPHLHRKCITILFCARLCIADAGSPFWGMLWSLFASEMERRNTAGHQYYSFHLVLDLPNGEDTLPAETLCLPESVVNEVLHEQIHGVLAIGLEAKAYTWLTQHNIPTVTFAGLGTCKVLLNSHESTKMGAQALIELGCRRPELWLHSSIDPNSDVLGIWHSTLQQAGYEVREHALRTANKSTRHPYTSTNYQEQGYQLGLQVFGNTHTEKPDGIYVENDLMTAGVLCALEELGLQVGKDVHIVSHANVGSPILADIRTRAMTLLEVDPHEIVKIMFLQLDTLLEDSQAGAENIYIPLRKRSVTRPV